MSEADQTSARETLLTLLTGHLAPHVIHTATQLALPDLLASGVHTTEDLAERTGTHAPSLARLLRAMACVGLVTEPAPGRYESTPMGALLRRDHADSLNATVLLNFREEARRSWGELLHSVRTGEPSFEHLYQTSAFAYFAGKPEVGEVFNRAMADHTRQAARDIVAGHDFGGYGTVVDVGGNDGTLLSAVLAASPETRGVLFDSAEGTARAPETLRRAGVDKRCEIVAGDFFEAVPEGGDAYLLKSVIHDWDDERSTAVLGSCRRAMTDGAVLLIVEPVMPDRADETLTVPMVVSDINMLVYTGGRERTHSEFEALLTGAGFALTGVSAPLRTTDYRVVEARPV
ncbi:methyltransferase [Streptomyces sp. 4F14]|uniref:methyltransferase n=1 Tax=Streptomyces sp. 4F14 TaxID=3394380 RepID=UPI003A8AD545